MRLLSHESFLGLETAKQLVGKVCSGSRYELPEPSPKDQTPQRIRGTLCGQLLAQYGVSFDRPKGRVANK
jgi:hypothetical protein